MIKANFDAQIVKICSMGLKPDHLGKSLSELRDHFLSLKNDFGFNVCGEGGEYESAILDCPLFKTHKIVANGPKVVVHDSNTICPVAYLDYSGIIEIVEKSE